MDLESLSATGLPSCGQSMNKLLRYLGYYHQKDLASYRQIWYNHGLNEGIKLGQRDRMIEVIDAQIDVAVASTRKKHESSTS